MTHNVQQYSSSEYLRLEKAVECSIFGTLVMPVFAAGDFVVGAPCLGAVEIVHLRKDVDMAREVRG